MLTRTVRHLERDGLLTRTAHPTVPPRVDYELTPAGRTLLQPAVALAEWAIENNPRIEVSRRAYDENRTGSGSDARPRPRPAHPDEGLPYPERDRPSRLVPVRATARPRAGATSATCTEDLR